jgi:cell division protein FtsB
MNRWVIVYRSAWGILIALFLLVVSVSFFVPRYQNLSELRRQKVQWQEENRRIEEMTKDLRIKQKLFKSDPGFVEHVARESGMVKPGETLFKFTSEKP